MPVLPMTGRDPYDLDGRVVAITGASSGIGAELARQCAERGARLALAARSEDKLERVAEDCRERGAGALVVPTDVSDEARCEAMVERIADEFGGIDVLVNNAGITMRARFEDIGDLSIFEKIMRVNYLGAVYCTRYALPYLKHRGGQAVAISSLTGKAGVPTRSAYSASKHAMQGFFDSIRVELRDTDMNVLVVSPGFVETPIRQNALDEKGQQLGDRGVDHPEAMPVDVCAAKILRGIEKRKREIVMTPTGKVGQWVKLIAPELMDLVAEKKVGES